MMWVNAAQVVKIRALAFGLLLAVFVAVSLLAAGPARAATTFTVVNTNDSGGGSLREAITAANANPGADTINFNIPPVTDPGCDATTSVCTIKPVVSGPPYFPDITDPVTIDGYTQQPGASANTKALADGDDAKLLIELDETTMSGNLTILADDTTVRGLVINGASADKITLGSSFNPPSGVASPSGVTIEGNFIGVTPDGTTAKAGISGFGIRQISGDNTTIGGATPAARNVISGNGQGGIIIEEGDAAVIQGNYIGPNADGTAALTQSEVGIRVISTPSFLRFSTNTRIAGNLISGNDNGGIDMNGSGWIQGNLIGTQRDGTSALGNENFGGIFLREGDKVDVGGTTSGEGNTIAFNKGEGVTVQATSGTTVKKGILGNSIYSNDRLGITLTSGFLPLPNDPGDGDSLFGNKGQNYPVIESASVSGSNATVSGTLNSTASTTFRLEFFANTACDASGNGEGQTFIGSTSVTTGSDGNQNFTFASPDEFEVPAGQSVITATATDPDNNTSEFSKCFTAEVGANSPPTATDDSYSTNQDTTLNEPAPGVLTNDTDANGDTLTATKVSDPSNGTLTLNSDGSFTYTPNAGFTGTDSFTYKANDGTNDSNVATVTVTVQGTGGDTTPPTVLSVNPSEGQTGVSRTTNITVTFSEAMNPSSFDANTVKLIRAGTTTPIPLTMTASTDGSGRTVLTLDPFGPTTQKLGRRKTYTVTVEGAADTDGFTVEDLAHNDLAEDKVWTFRTRRR